MDSYIGNSNCNDYRIGSNTVKALYKGDTLIWSKSSPTAVTELWLPLNDITNYQAFNAIAFETGYTFEVGDKWVSENPYVNNGFHDYWDDGFNEDKGWYSQHRWGPEEYGDEYAWSYDHETLAPDNGPRADLPESAITVSGNSVVCNVLEFNTISGWVPCYVTVTDQIILKYTYVYGRVQQSSQIWYTTTDGEIVIGQRGMGSIEQYGDNGGIIEYTTGSPMSYINTFRNHNGQTNIKTLIMPIGTVSADIKRNVFDYCTGLTTVVCPPTVTDFPSEVFYGCSSLNKVFLGCSVFPQHGLEHNVDVPVNGTFYVPTGCDMTYFPQTGRFANWDVVYQ